VSSQLVAGVRFYSVFRDASPTKTGEPLRIVLTGEHLGEHCSIVFLSYH